MVSIRRFAVSSAVICPSLLALACGAGPQPAVVFATVVFPKDQRAAAPPSDVSHVDSRHRAALQRVLEAAGRTVDSPRFKRYLSRLAEVAPALGSSPITGLKVHAVVFDVARLRPLPIVYRIGGETCKSRGGETARTGLGSAVAEMCIQPVVLQRAAAKEPEALACSVNTIVHEWTHTVPREESGMVYMFRDDDHDESSKPLVSYAIGSLAQCVFLEEQYGHLLTDEQMAWCIKSAGTIDFIYNTCASDWFSGVLSK